MPHNLQNMMDYHNLTANRAQGGQLCNGKVCLSQNLMAWHGPYDMPQALAMAPWPLALSCTTSLAQT